MRTITRVSAAWLAALALCAASSTRLEAQPWFELGLKGGVGFANLGGSDLQTPVSFFQDFGAEGYALGTFTSGLGDMKTDFVGGAYAVAHVNERFGIRLEALYARKGSKGHNSGTIAVFDSASNFVGSVDVSGKNTLTLSYLEVPLLAVAYFPAGPAGSFEVFAGPSLAFQNKAELKADVTLSANGYSETQAETIDIGKATASTDFGGVFGVGYSRRAAGMILSVEARWTQGFSRVDDASEMDWKNHALGLSLGIGFPLGGGR